MGKLKVKVFLAILLVIMSFSICYASDSGEILPTGITLSKSSTEICIGFNNVDTKCDCSVLTTPTILPDNATDKTVTWTSSDTSILDIKNDRIVAKQKGKIVLTAKTVNGLTASCDVEIVDHKCFTDNNYQYDENNHWQNG